MPRWSDLAHWYGTDEHAGPLHGHQGLVVHIAEGTYEGTIAWQRGNNSVSSHFIVDRDGTLAQMVDTDTIAWTQRAGNPYWLSVECAGFTKASPHYRDGWERLTDQQIHAIAVLLARAHKVYGVPLQIASNPNDHGLGHHSMGGRAWGHLDCPGVPIIGQKSAIVAAAKGIIGPAPAPAPGGGEYDMSNLPNLRRGAKGHEVQSVQTLGNLRAGGANVTVDGDFGPNTEALVKRVQQGAHITVDGVVGPHTWSVLLTGRP